MERNSIMHDDIERIALEGNLEAAHALAWNHLVGFEDGDKNFTEALKLFWIAMPAKLPDTFFLMAAIGPVVSLSDEEQYALTKMGESFEQTEIARFKEMGLKLHEKLDVKLSNSQKL